MEIIANGGEKGDDGTLQLLYELHKKPRPNPEYPIYVHLKEEYPWPVLLERFMQKLAKLQEQKLLTYSPYKSEWRTDPATLEIRLLPKGLQLVKTHTETVTKTVTETVQLQPILEPEQKPAWKLNERRRQFLKTERGFGIMNSQLDDFLNDVTSKIMKIRRGNLPRKDMKSMQMWLMYALLYRGSEMSAELKIEARDCRDLPYTSRRRGGSKS